jgi:hypothetical protein
MRGPVSREQCELWKQRRPLPLARAQFEISNKQTQQLVSALLVVSGLGSFAVSIDGNPLSSSSVQDPPLTDYSQRVSYGGFDVTKFVKNTQSQSAQQQHVLGITLGSGWWDHRPINGKIVFQDLIPKGPLTTIAQLYVTFQDGKTAIKIQTNAQDGIWQMGKGHIVESNLYTGETINLATLNSNKGWDMPTSAAESKNTQTDDDDDDKTSLISWVSPILYKNVISAEEWHNKLQSYAYNHTLHQVSNIAPIGKLLPIQIPPVLPIDRIAPESVVDLGNGPWLFDFGKAMSGVVRFEKGLPSPTQPAGGQQEYPRGHNVTDNSAGGHEAFITVVYGASLEMTTGDINLILVGGFGK